MSNKNTARVGIYLPHEIKDWYAEEAKKTDRPKANDIMIQALLNYKENSEVSKRKKEDAADSRIRALIRSELVRFSLINE